MTLAISPKILQIGIYLLLFTNRKTYVGFLMAPSTLTFSDLERSNWRSYIFWVAISPKILQILTYLLLFTNKKSYMGFLMTPPTLTFSYLDQTEDHAYFEWLYLVKYCRQVYICYYSLIGSHIWAFSWHHQLWPWKVKLKVMHILNGYISILLQIGIYLL